MIDYELYCKIKDRHDTDHLTIAQIARELHLNARTVGRWLAADKFRQRATPPRPSKLDGYKGQIVGWLQSHPYTATQVFLRLRETGYSGGITIVKDYVHHIRPPRTPAFLTLSFAPGECAQVDWGQFGSIGVGNTRRRLSFFVMATTSALRSPPAASARPMRRGVSRTPSATSRRTFWPGWN